MSWVDRGMIRHALPVALVFALLAGCARPATTPRAEATLPPSDTASGSQTPASTLEPAPSVPPTSAEEGAPAMPANSEKIVRTDAEWRKLLTPEQYRVMREK